MPFQGGSRVNLASIDAQIANLGTLSVTGNADIAGTLAQHGQATFDVTPKVGAVSLVRDDDARLVTPTVSAFAPRLFAGSEATMDGNLAYCRIRTEGGIAHVEARHSVGVGTAAGRVYIANIPLPKVHASAGDRHFPAVGVALLNGGASFNGVCGLRYSRAEGIWFVAPSTGLGDITSALAVNDYVILHWQYEVA